MTCRYVLTKMLAANCRVRVNPEDIGRVIGRNGRTANAIRIVVQALSNHNVRVDIMDVRK